MADDKRTDDKKNGTAKAAPEDLMPTPTQAENDEFKAKMFGVEVAKREAKDVEALPPTPTQAENDAAKTAAMYVHVPPEGSGDPQKTEAQPQAQRRTVEAKPSSAGYETRSVAAAPVKAEAE